MTNDEIIGGLFEECLGDKPNTTGWKERIEKLESNFSCTDKGSELALIISTLIADSNFAEIEKLVEKMNVDTLQQDDSHTLLRTISDRQSTWPKLDPTTEVADYIVVKTLKLLIDKRVDVNACPSGQFSVIEVFKLQNKFEERRPVNDQIIEMLKGALKNKGEDSRYTPTDPAPSQEVVVREPPSRPFRDWILKYFCGIKPDPTQR